MVSGSFEEWYGEHPIFEHQNTKEGVIDSLPSKLKEVYKRYLRYYSRRRNGHCSVGVD